LKEDEDHISLIRYVLHNMNNMRTDRFPMALKAGMKHFPDDLGFLFEKDDRDDEKNTCQLALKAWQRRGLEGNPRMYPCQRQLSNPSSRNQERSRVYE